MVPAVRIPEDSTAHLRFGTGQSSPSKMLMAKGGSIVYFMALLVFELLVSVSALFTSNFKFALRLRLHHFQFLNELIKCRIWLFGL